MWTLHTEFSLTKIVVGQNMPLNSLNNISQHYDFELVVNK